MSVSRRNLLSMWMANLRLLYRHLGFDALWLFMMLFFITYLHYQKYETENINLVESINIVILMLVFLEPLITNVVQGTLDTLSRYIVGGVDLAYVIIMNNLTTLAVSSLGIVTIMLGIWVSVDRFWQHGRLPLAYFSISIFPLIILGNYVSVFRHFLGLGSDSTIIRRLCFHTVLIAVASIPYLLIRHVLESSPMCLIMILLSIAVWYITVIRYVSILARRHLFNLLESG